MAKETVDTRVVRMEFDNKQFEKNVKQTSKSLETLKQDLDFKGVGDSIEQVKIKISALQVTMATFIANITNKIINLGVTLVKSLSVDNISTGWAKFGEKTTSVATMMAQKIRIAGEEITDLARKTEVVNEQLELLTWFSDETSYSFTDMVNNVGKFIAAGQDLDVSVKAMEGIATWAAKAGQNSQTASRAMYQLAQAMGKGKIQKIDWMSIQNANMDTEDFRETILATAVAMGELTKEGDKFVTKTGKKFTQSQFADFLSEGWFTSDVLVKGLSKYSAAVEQIYEIANREGITASEVMEKYADQLDEFGMSAFKAAQEARTFSDVLNSVKDAVSSKWMQTFENIFGGQEEAVKLWTELANELYDVFAESGNFRNDILAVWKEFGGRDDIFGEHGEPNQGAFWNLYDAIIAVRDLIKKAWDKVFPLSQMESASDQIDDIARRLKDLTQRIKDFTYNLKMSEELGSRLSKIFQVIFSLLKGGVIVLKTIRFIIDPIIELGKQIVGQVLDQVIYSTNKLLKVGNSFESFAVRLQNIIANLIDSLNVSAIFDDVFSFIKDTFKILENLHPIESLVRFIEDFTKAFEDAGGTSENFKKIINSVLSVIKLLRKAIVSIVLTLTKYVVPVLDDIIDILVKISGFILGTAVKIVSIIADLITNINNAFQGKGNAEEFKNEIFGILEQLGNLAKSIIPIVGSLIKIILKLVEVVLLLPKMLNELSKRLTGKGIIDNLNSLFDGIINAISNFINGIKNTQSKPGSFSNLFNSLISVIEGLWEVVKGLLSIAELVFTILGSALKKIGLAIQYIADMFIKVFSGRARELTSAEKQMFGVIAALGVLALIGVTLYNTIWLIISIFEPISVVADSMTGLMDSLAFKFKMDIFDSFANALLKFSASIILLAGLKTEAMYKAATILIAFAAVVGMFAIIIANMSKSVTTFSREAVKIGGEFSSEIKYNNLLIQISSFINLFSKALLKISLALAVISSINNENLHKGITILIAIFGMIVILLNAIKYLSETNIDESLLSKFKNIMLSTALTMIIVSIAFKQLAGIEPEQLNRAILGYAAFMLGFLSFLHIIDSVNNIEYIEGILKSFITISAVLLALALSVKILSGINPGPLWMAIGAITTLIISISIALKLINKQSSSIKITEIKGAFAKYSGIALMLVALSGTLLIIKSSLLTLSFIPCQKLIAPVIAIGALLAAFAGSVKLMLSGNTESSTRKALNILIVLGALSMALSNISGTLILLSFIPWQKLIAPVIAIGALLAAFAGSIKLILSGNKESSIQNALSILIVLGALSIALSNISGALILLSFIPWHKLIAPVIAIGVLLAAFAGSIKLILSGNTESSIKNALSILIVLGALSMALLSIAGILSILATIPWTSLIVPVISMVAILVALTLYLSVIHKSISREKLSGIAKILLVMGSVIASIIVLASTLKMLSDIPWENLLVSALSIFGIIVILSGLTLALSKMFKGGDASDSIIKLSLAFSILSISMIPLAYALRMFSDIPMDSIGRGFLVIVGGIITLALAAKLLTPIIPAMAGIAGVLLLLGMATLTAGVGLRAIVESLILLNQDFTPALQNLADVISNVVTSVIGGLLNTLPSLIGVITDFTVSIAKIILDSLTELTPNVINLLDALIEGINLLLKKHGVPLMETFVELIDSIINGIKYLLIKHGNDIIEIVVSLAVSLIDSFLKIIAEHRMSMAQSIIEIFISILSVIEKNMPTITSIFVGILIGFLDGLRTKIGPLVDSFTNFVFDFLARVIYELSGVRLLALTALITKVVLIVIANVMVLTIASLGVLSGLFLIFVSSILLIMVHTFMGLRKVLLEIFKVIIKESLILLVEAIIWAQDAFVAIGKMIINLILRGVIMTFLSLAGWLLDLIDLIFGTNIRSSIQAAANALANEAKNLVEGIDAGTDKVFKAVENASNNIGDVISYASNSANKAVISGISVINKTVTNSMNLLSDSMIQFGEDSGYNLYTGLGSSDNIKGANQVGQDMGNAAAEGFSNATETHSPSRLFARFGNFLMQGLGIGIQNGASETENIMSEVIGDSLKLATDILNGQDGDDYTIKVGMDISSVEAQTSKIQDMMAGVNNPNITASGKNAGYNAKALERNNRNGSETINNDNSTTVTYNNTFNIESTDPQQSADEIDKVLKEQNTRFKLAHGT